MSWSTVNEMLDRVHEGLADSQQTFFGPAEELAALNEGMLQLFCVAVAENVGLFFTTTPETAILTSTSNYVTLSNDFVKISEIIPTNDSDRGKKFFTKSRHSEDFRDLLNVRAGDAFGDPDHFYYDVVSDRTLVVVPRPVSNLSLDIYTIREPTLMTAGTSPPPVKLLFRPLIVEYAVRKLKGKQETGSYTSHETLLKFMLENLSKVLVPRAETNQRAVDEYDP